MGGDEAREGELVNDMPPNVTPLCGKRDGEQAESAAERKARQKRAAEEEQTVQRAAAVKALVERMQQQRAEREEHEAEPGEGHAT